MQALVDQARAESIIPKPKIKIVKEYIDRSPKVTDDVMFENAVQVILEKRKASTSLLQRELGIGYGRAARIMEQLEGKGYITSPAGSHAREVILLNRDEEIDIAKRMVNDMMSIT